ncbi:MAG: hypothetical protein JXD22_14300 [Sedimentisphaerales bacterium]|nr:hypothetical protein [Sedimentisphaerales bacterium]
MVSCNSRLRVLKTLSHQEPDKIVVDLGASTSTGISAIAYNNLKKALNINGMHTHVFDVIQQLAMVDDCLLDRFGVDIVSIDRDYDTSDDSWKDVTLSDNSVAQWPAYFNPRKRQDGSWDVLDDDDDVIGRMPSSGTFFDQTVYPYLDAYPDHFKTIQEDMKKVLWTAYPLGPWRHVDEADFWHRLRRQGEKLRDSGRAVLLTLGFNLVQAGMFLRRMDNFLMDIYTDPQNVMRLVKTLADIYFVTLQETVEKLGDLVDVFRIGDDLGMYSGPFMSPEVYRKLFKPVHKEFCAYIKKHTQAYTCLHSCGSIYEMIPDLIDAGFDSLNPVQTNCHNMDPAVLKREFGRDITFWGGGCDTTTMLNRATAEQIHKHVLERLKVFSPGGGFIFSTVHNILPEVPPENIIAMFRAVDDFNGRANKEMPEILRTLCESQRVNKQNRRVRL